MVGLSRAGYDVEVLIPNGWYPPLVSGLSRAWTQARAQSVPANWHLDGIHVSDLRVQNRVPSRFCRPLDYVERVSVALQTRLERESTAVDSVLMAQFALPYGGAVHDAATALALPYVVQLRGDDVWIWPHRSDRALDAFVRTVTGASLVLGVSDALLEEAHRLCGRELPPSAVVPNGIDLRRFRPPADASARTSARAACGVPPDGLVLLCVGDSLVRNGWLDLLDALGAWSDRPPELVLLGVAGTRFNEIDILREARSRAPGLRVVLRRGLSRDEIADAYRAADVFCLASHWEGMANALLEALASGLPVIATSVAGHPEVVTPEQEGWLVPPRQPTRLREALREALTDGRLRSRMGEAARRRAEAVGDSGTAGRRLARLLDAVKSGGPSTGAVLDAIETDSPYSVRSVAGAAS
jgi:glycosyltransferase involved in cell wall biosynthesis